MPRHLTYNGHKYQFIGRIADYISTTELFIVDITDAVESILYFRLT